LGVPQEFQKPPVAAHPPLPPPESPTTDNAAKRRKSIGVPKINMHTYQPDEQALFTAMFGKEANVDPYTGQLVLATKPPPGPTGNGQQRQ
jgi:hypothetical protein